MKNLILSLVAVCALSFTAVSQTKTFASSYSNLIDTVTNTATNYVTIASTAPTRVVSVQAVLHKISGTIAGSCFLQGSNDGTNYVPITTGYTGCDGTNTKSATLDTVTATNVTTNTFTWKLSVKQYKYYRIGWTGSGTMVGTLSGVYFYNAL